MHAYMVPSTGYLKEFIIKPYSPGLIIQYPRYELNGVIPVFQDAPVYGRTLKRAYEWSKMIDTETIFDINQKITPKNLVDFIQTCETKHNNMIAELGKMIADDIENIRLIAIAGPSSSGKTTFSNRLRIELLSRGIKPIMISMDDYYLDRDKIAPGPDGKLDLEDINTLDIDLFNQHMYALINGEEVEIPRFDFNIAKRVKGHKLRVPANQPIIIEGIHALNDKLTHSVPRNRKFKIYCSPLVDLNYDAYNSVSSSDIRLLRRMVRDNLFRSTDAEGTFAHWEGVQRGERKNIFPYTESADVIFNSAIIYEPCLMRTFASEPLRSVSTDSPYYYEAQRLLRLLERFAPMDDRYIPSNAYIREFIGDSSFHY
jgi:uridine kinase